VLGSDGVRVTREHAKGDVAARGTISDLALLMTGRLPPARLEVFGDTVHLDRWFRAVRF
jgi:transcription-repair coupling factor (superfamily II helicase)